MIDLKRINKKEDLKTGMDILRTGGGSESLERIDCIDGSEISTVSPINNEQKSFKHDLDRFFDRGPVYEVKPK